MNHEDVAQLHRIVKALGQIIHAQQNAHVPDNKAISFVTDAGEEDTYFVNPQADSYMRLSEAEHALKQAIKELVS